MSELVRTFIAIEIENKEVLSRLVEVRDQLLGTGADIKGVEDENIHLTLRFLGEIRRDVIGLLCEELSKLKFPKFRIHIRGISAFPLESRPRVIWAGIEEGSEKVIELNKLVESIIRKLGVPREREEFVPHITLARVKTHKNIERLVTLLRSLAGIDFGYSSVSSIHVKRSVLTPRGPIYSDLCSVHLE